jgi:uncharacterized membrane protein YhaH (DUF805 family)
MELWEATKLAFRQYATFSGISSRANYWYFVLALVIINVVTSIISESLAATWSIISLLPLLAASARRFRDAGLSMHNFWWVLVPFAGLIALIIQLGKPTIQIQEH